MCKCAWLKKIFSCKENCCCHAHETAPVTPAPEAAPAKPEENPTVQQ